MLTFLIRSIKSAFLHVFRNKLISFTAVSSIVVMFSLSSLFLIIGYFFNQVSLYLETQAPIIIRISKDCDIIDMKDIEKKLVDTNYTSEIKIVTPDDAKKRFIDKYKDIDYLIEALEDSDSNPLRGSIEIKAKSIDDLTNLKSEIDNLSELNACIASVSEVPELITNLKSLFEFFRTLGIIIISLVFLSSIIVIIFTFKIALLNYSEEISIMSLIGANKSYIFFPFVIKGILFGFLGGLFSNIFIYFLFLISKQILTLSPTLEYITRYFHNIDLSLLSYPNIVYIALVEICIGIMLGLVLSVLSIKKFNR